VQYERTDPTDGSGQFFVAEGAGLLTVVNTNSRIDLLRPAAESLIRTGKTFLVEAFVENCQELGGLTIERPNGSLSVPSLNGEFFCMSPANEIPRALVDNVTVEGDAAGPAIKLLLTDAGLGAINRQAEVCFAEGPECPTGMAAIMLDGRLQSTTGFSAPVFTEKVIVISSFPPLSEEDVAWASDVDPRRITFHPVLDVLDAS